jgi:predicted flavoprotein YhiN
MKRQVAIVGAGAVGAFAGGMMADAGQRVFLIDAWPGHVKRSHAAGGADYVVLRVREVDGRITARAGKRTRCCNRWTARR